MKTSPAVPKPVPSIATRPLRGSSLLLMSMITGWAAAEAASVSSRAVMAMVRRRQDMGRPFGSVDLPGAGRVVLLGSPDPCRVNSG
jgi:hypothetical protein